MRAFIVALMALVACRANHTGALPLTSSASPEAQPAPGAAAEPTWANGEADWEGTFNGAPLHATLDHEGSSVTGSLFYDRFGASIAVQGSFDAGVLTLSELDRGKAISTATLRRSPDGTFSGEWEGQASRRGPAALSPIVATDVVPVATRHEKTQTRCEAEALKDGASIKVVAVASLDVPVVLGLANRSFEHALNRALASRARALVPSCPLGIDLRFTVPLDERGLLGVVLRGDFTADPRIGMYGPSHSSGAAGVQVSDITGARVSLELDDIADRARLRRAVSKMILDRNEQCVTGPAEDPLALLLGFVPTSTGAELCLDACVNHAHEPVCVTVPAGVHSVLKSPFTRLDADGGA